MDYSDRERYTCTICGKTFPDGWARSDAPGGYWPKSGYLCDACWENEQNPQTLSNQ